MEKNYRARIQHNEDAEMDFSWESEDLGQAMIYVNRKGKLLQKYKLEPENYTWCINNYSAEIEQDEFLRAEGVYNEFGDVVITSMTTKD